MLEYAWIQDQNTANIARFRLDPKSCSGDPMDVVDSGRTSTGTAPLLKAHRHRRRKERGPTS